MQVYILSQSFATLAAILLPLKKRFEGRGDFFLSLAPMVSFNWWKQYGNRITESLHYRLKSVVNL